MRPSGFLSLLVAALPAMGAPTGLARNRDERPAPKVMLINMFDAEAGVFPTKIHEAGLGNVTQHSIRIPGLFPEFPAVTCVDGFDVCQMTAGMGEINAAASTMALALSPQLDLRHTYFMLAGIGGVSPQQATLGSVALARFVVQVALQYELDGRELPDGVESGYVPYGAKRPGEYPTITYGTEVVEVSAALRDRAVGLARNAALADSGAAKSHRAKYADAPEHDGFAAATVVPSVVACDVATSDVYYSGKLLSEAFDATTTSWTNGTGKYCMTASEDAAVLAALVRTAIEGLVDMNRVIVMRTGSNFDRPPPNMTAYDHLFVHNQNGFDIAIENLGRAGVEIVRGIVDGWDCTYAKGLAADNYVGDILGSLGGEPDFGLGSITQGKGFAKAWDEADETDKTDAEVKDEMDR